MILAQNPVSLLNELAPPGQPEAMRQYAAGFEDIFEGMPKLDPRVHDHAALERTRHGMARMTARVRHRLGCDLHLPKFETGKFGRIYLGMEEAHREGDHLVGGTEVLLALWPRGFRSPVHGHAPGYINEEIIFGAANVFTYQAVARPSDRFAIGVTGTRQGPGRFASFFEPDIGQEKRSTLIHSFEALEDTVTIHYLPDHTRDGRDNRYTVVGNTLNGPFSIDSSRNLTRVTGAEAMDSVVGDVYIVRSKRVAQAKGGDHAILIVGGLVEKPQGLRPNEATFPIGDTPLQEYSADEELVLLKLGADARADFYDHFDVPVEFQRR